MTGGADSLSIARGFAPAIPSQQAVDVHPLRADPRMVPPADHPPELARLADAARA